MYLKFYTSTKYVHIYIYIYIYIFACVCVCVCVCVASQRICAFHMFLSKRGKYFPIQQQQVRYYNREVGSLLRGTG